MKNIIKYMFICTIPLLFSSCYTKVILPENNSNNEENNISQLSNNKRLVEITEGYLFYKTNEDLIRDKYKFGEGIYYIFDFNNYVYNWSNTIELLYDLSQLKVSITDLWYQGRSSSCGDPKTNTAYFMIVKKKLLIRLEFADSNLNTLGFKRTSKLSFSCPYNILHYSRYEEE